MKKTWLLSLVLVGLLFAGPLIGVAIANNQEQLMHDPVEEPVEEPVEDPIEEPVEDPCEEEPVDEPCEDGTEEQDYKEHGEDNDNDGIDDEKEVERDLITVVEPGVILIESEFSYEGYEDEFNIWIITTHGLVYELEYFAAINSTVTEMALRLEFCSLVEFLDENEDGLVSEEEEFRSINLCELEFSDPNIEDFTSKDGEVGFMIESHFKDGDFKFQVISYIFPTFAQIDNLTVTPSEMKLTFVIMNFPYEWDQSKLNLVIEANSEVAIHVATDDPEISVEKNNATAFFSWDEIVLADGEKLPVISDVRVDEWGTRVALTYPRATELVHDPTLGLSTPFRFPQEPNGLPIDMGDILQEYTIYLLGGSAIIALVITIAIARTRPRLQNSH